MSSERRKAASRANGNLSRGPVTPEGKARSAMNALRHGLLSKTVVVGKENPDNFNLLVHEHRERFPNLDGVEFGMVEEMCAAYWRMRRIWGIEKEWLEQETAKDPEENDITRLANAFARLADTNKYKVLNRYENRMHRIYQKSLKTLLTLQAKRAQSDQLEFDFAVEPESAGPEPTHTPESGPDSGQTLAPPAQKSDQTNLIPIPNTTQSQPKPAAQRARHTSYRQKQSLSGMFALQKRRPVLIPPVPPPSPPQALK